jgi:hypothetical protein
MKTTTKLLCMLIAVFIATSLNAQDIKPILENEKQVTYKISAYSVDTDKLIKKEFSNDKMIRIVYTCIPTGILVFESKTNISTVLKEEIEGRLKKAHEAIQFLHMQGFTLKEAEEKCASKRSVN